MPAGRSSTISTDAPRRASSYATAQPTMPAPTTTISQRPEAILFQLNSPLAEDILRPSVHTHTAGGIMSVAPESVLTDRLLEKCRERAPKYDQENRFCQEDFDELKAAGYLMMAVPREFGGLGMSLAQVSRETRRLAMYAPPTALCINMHNYWVGLTADLWRSGDKSLEWLLREAAAGEVFAAGHAETGNDIPLLPPPAKAEKVSGGYKFTGRKSVGSLSPVWAR